MPFDAARMESLALAVTLAQARVYAAITPAQRILAEQQLATARAEQSAAWTAYHNEVQTVADQLMGRARSTDVIGLFPVALEAKLEPAQRRLRLRVWPDMIAQAHHDPRLEVAEKEAGQRYWIAEAAATSDDARLEAWRQLARDVGTTRAAWVAQALTPTNRDRLGPGVVPQFPDVAMVDPATPFVVQASMLPDRWVVLGYNQTESGSGNERRVYTVRVLAHVGGPIQRPLVTGLDTTPAEVASLRNGDGRAIELPRRMRWMTSFEAAVEAGMAMTIPVPDDLHEIGHLLVFGIRDGEAAAGASELEALLTAHRFGQGLAFAPQETPTNNSPSGGAGLPSAEQAIDDAYKLERKPRVFTDWLRSNGKQTAAALGVSSSLLATAPNSGATARVYMEPEGYEPELQRSMQLALWYPALGTFFEDFVGVAPARLDALRTFYLEHVRPEGALPILRIGRQPYGVLPVTTLDGFRATAAEGIDAHVPTIIKATRRSPANWNQFVPQPEAGLVFTGRPFSYLFEDGTPDHEDNSSLSWRGIAEDLWTQSDHAIAPDWADGPPLRMGRTISDREQDRGWAGPRPIADADTKDAINQIATARPSDLLASPVGGSLLTRMVRYAALLEWTCFARAVYEDTLREDTATLARIRAAAQPRHAVWIELLLHAMGTLDGAPPLTLEPPLQRRIAAAVVSLENPPNACPGARRLIAFRNALQLITQAPVALNARAYGTLSLGVERVDAWQTALASCRLARLRATQPRGLIVGGFGWLHTVRSSARLPAFSPEFIHAPSHDQAATAAVLRSAALRAENATSGHAEIDLSSARVRQARWLTEAVRSGKSLAELLGARLERGLKEREVGSYIADLRREYPGPAGSTIVDGLRALAAWKSATLVVPDRGPPARAQLDAVMTEIDGAFDAVADALKAEAVYQLVRGNPAGALMDIDDVTRGAPPPPLRVTETPVNGTRLTHRVAAVVPAGASAPGWPTIHTPRADADPLLDAWCGHLLGRVDATVLTVRNADAPGNVTVSVGLDRLAIAAIDVVAATADAGAELRDRVLVAASQLHAVARGAIVEDRAWKTLLALGTQIARLIARAEPLGRDALTRPGEAPAAVAATGDLQARATAARTRLEGLRDVLARPSAPATAVREAWGFGIRVPGTSIAVLPSPSDQAALLAAVRARLATAATATDPRERLRALIGDGVLGLVAVTPPDASTLATAASPPQDTLGVDGARCASWLELAGRVHPSARRLADILSLAELSGRLGEPGLRVAQSPWVTGDPWIATAWTNTGTSAPAAGRLSIVFHAPAGLDPSRAIGGLLIDAWSETLPASRRDTGLAIHFNGPNTRPPQTLLLAVAPDTSVPSWTAEMMSATLRDTLQAVFNRPLFGLYPMLSTMALGRSADGTGISFTPPESTT